MDKKDFIRTGEFAKLTGVSKQTLIFYDKQGIFKPSVVDVNNYRYYSFSQLETFTLIYMLREMNVPITEIKANLDNGDPDKLLDLLEKKDIEIDKKIEKLNWCKRCIKEKIIVTKDAIEHESDKIYIQELPDEYMVMTEINRKMPKEVNNVSEAVINLFTYCINLGVNSSFAVGGIIPVGSITETTFSYSHIYKVVEKKENIDTIVLDRSGLFLACYSDEGYNEIIITAKKLLNYAAEHGLILGKYIYEDTLLDDLSNRDYNHYKVKLSIKIIGGVN